MSIQLIRAFGPTIAKIKIPNEMVKALNDYVDGLILDKKKSKELSAGANLAGDVTQEFKLEKEFSQRVGWLDLISKGVFQWIQMSTNQSIKEFKMIDSWIVRQFQNEYNPVHMHGGHVSGAGFLKVPKTFGKYVQEEKDGVKHYAGGTLNLIHGSKQFLSKSTFQIRPEVGDFYFFPNYMMHTVYPFKDTDEERRSISFNAFVDQSIYDTF
jgi:hypothetical protein|tara:strand:+ start:321 stop:953 length:633 start_codon:yes stop_codon:yes gene_type:complete